MFRYFLKRLLLFIPSMILIGLFAFILFHASSTDPVESLLTIDGYEQDVITNKAYTKQYKTLAASLNLDLPIFYFSIIPNYYPDDFHSLVTKQEKKIAKSLLKYHNDWDAVKAFLVESKKIIDTETSQESKELVDKLVFKTAPESLSASLGSDINQNLKDELAVLLNKALAISSEKKSIIVWPKLVWHGVENQFHSWFANFFSGSMGRSALDGRPVWQKIKSALGWTLFMVLTSLILALLIAVPLGVWSAYNIGSRLDNILSNLFYFIYALPLFWYATLMVVFFTTSQYGSWTNIFPGVGFLPASNETSLVSKLASNYNQLILPIFCLAIHSVAFVSRVVRTNIISESTQQYKVTAMLKGLTQRAVYWKHLFPNSILPLLTIIIGVIPASLAGSLVLEVIFNIPGIGRLMYDSIFGNDLFVIFSIVMIVGLITILSYWLGDILYSVLNPKIKFSNQENKA